MATVRACGVRLSPCAARDGPDQIAAGRISATDVTNPATAKSGSVGRKARPRVRAFFMAGVALCSLEHRNGQHREPLTAAQKQKTERQNMKLTTLIVATLFIGTSTIAMAQSGGGGGGGAAGGGAAGAGASAGAGGSSSAGGNGGNNGGA